MARQKIRKIIRRLGPNKAENKRNIRQTSGTSTQINDIEKCDNTSDILTSSLDDTPIIDDDKFEDVSDGNPEIISQIDDDEKDEKIPGSSAEDVDIMNEVGEIDDIRVIDVSPQEKGHTISEKIVKHYYIPKRSKFWWLKLFCCLVIIALLIWILYCLYNGCGNNNCTNQSSTNTSNSMTTTTGSVRIDRETMIKEPRTGKVVGDSNPTQTDISKSQDMTNMVGKSTRTQTDVNISNDKNIMSSDLPYNTDTQKPRKEIKFGTFNTPEEVSFDFVSIKGETVIYRGIDWKSHEKSLEDYEVMKSEVTFREYSYFTNIHNEHLPEYRNKSEQDVNIGTNSSYSNTCFNKDCPVVGISVEDINAYIKWLNNKTGDSYKIISEAQWHQVSARPDLETEVWYEENSNGRAHGVRIKDKNKRGIYGLYGNASELCTTNEGYGIIGGSWDSPEKALFKSSEVGVKIKSNSMGFRLVKINKTNKDEK